jgi:hypothetical protein
MRYFILFLAACALIDSCDSPSGLQAVFSNRIDTVSLYALTRTPVSLPSGYSISGRQTVRTEVGASFDFAFDIDTTGRPVLLPTGPLKLGQQSGIRLSAQDFDSILFAPTTGFNVDSAQLVHENTVLLVMTRATPCQSAVGFAAPYYAKLHVLAIDTTSTPNGRRIDFLILVDVNCGFRGLEQGLPKR